MSETLDKWFVREVLPQERALTRFLRDRWSNGDEIDDLRQEVYARAFEAAATARPFNTRAFLYVVARNLIADRYRRAAIVQIDAVADMERLNVSTDEPWPDQQVNAREELRRTQAAIELLPPRSRDVLVMRRIEGAPQKEVAARLGIKEDTVEKTLSNAVRRLAALLFTEEPSIDAKRAPADQKRAHIRRTDNGARRRD